MLSQPYEVLTIPGNSNKVRCCLLLRGIVFSGVDVEYLLMAKDKVP